MTNLLRTSWEYRLAEYGLANRQFDKKGVLCLIVNGESTGIQNHQFDRALDSHAWKNDTARHVDDDELFRFHEIPVRLFPREVPTWAVNNCTLSRILLSIFPRLGDSARQRYRAGQACALIYRYYRLCEPASGIAADMGISVDGIKRRIQRVKRKAAALGFVD